VTDKSSQRPWTIRRDPDARIFRYQVFAPHGTKWGFKHVFMWRARRTMAAGIRFFHNHDRGEHWPVIETSCTCGAPLV
jgi:hypothetical protein